MAGRLPNIAAVGSLLKTPGQPRKAGKVKPGRDEKHLALIRQLPCLKCGKSPCDAAHVKVAVFEHDKKPGTPKQDDKWTLPLCHDHHMEQHSQGENEFWARLKIDPIGVCLTLKMASGLEEMQRIVRIVRARCSVSTR
jgi:hypothetical protein